MECVGMPGAGTLSVMAVDTDIVLRNLAEVSTREMVFRERRPRARPAHP